MHPEEAFLRNHRASAADVARQEAERVLADEVWVRSPLARARLLEAGHAPTLVRLLSQAPVARGIPIIATDRATGAHAVHRVPRGDVEALVEQLRLLDATHDRVHCP
jgi:hypothetical protein